MSTVFPRLSTVPSGVPHRQNWVIPINPGVIPRKHYGFATYPQGWPHSAAGFTQNRLLAQT